VRITRISLNNFLSYSDEREIKLKDLNLLVGPNGAGKTNVLRAVTFVDRALSRQLTSTDSQSYAYDTSKPFTVRLGISLSDEEKKALKEHIILSLIWDYQNITSDLEVFSNFLARNGERIVDQPPDITDVFISSTMSTRYPLELRLVIRWGESTSTYDLFSGLLRQGPGNIGDLSSLVFNNLRDLGCSFPPNQPVNIPDELPSIGLAKIVEEAFKNFGMIHLPSARHDILLQPNAKSVRESGWYTHLLQFLAKRKRFDVNITFDDLFIIMFNSSLVVLDQWRGRPPEYVELAETIEPQSDYDFWGLKNQSLPETLTLDAESVTRTLFELYTSDSVENKQRFKDIESRMCKLTGFKPLIIIGTDKKSVRRKVAEFRTLQGLTDSPITNPPVLTLSEKEETRRVYVYRLAFERQADRRVFGWDRLAAGDVETLFILTALEGYEERVILLDEPGQNLHPTRQRQILEVIKEASKKNQILFTTHSSHLVDREVIPGIIRITSKDKVSKFHQVREEFSEDEWKAIGKNQGLIESLFSRATVMCEGDDEYWVAQISLPKALGVGTVADSEIVTVRGEGKCSFRYYNILEKFGVDFLILCDQDTLNEMKEEYKNRCVYFRDKDTYEFLEKKYSNEFEVCRKELGRDGKKDKVVLWCVLKKIKPPDAVKELAQRLKAETSDKTSTNCESRTGPSTKA